MYQSLGLGDYNPLLTFSHFSKGGKLDINRASQIIHRDNWVDASIYSYKKITRTENPGLRIKMTLCGGPMKTIFLFFL